VATHTVAFALAPQRRLVAPHAGRDDPCRAPVLGLFTGTAL
jgi:hypothetical protein